MWVLKSLALALLGLPVTLTDTQKAYAAMSETEK